MIHKEFCRRFAVLQIRESDGILNPLSSVSNSMLWVLIIIILLRRFTLVPKTLDLIHSYWCCTFRNNVTPSQSFPKQALVFMCSTRLLRTPWKKEKLLITSDFSFPPSVFYPFEEISAIFTKFEIIICKLCQFWMTLKFFIWEKVI